MDTARTVPTILCLIISAFLVQNVQSEYRLCAPLAKVELCKQLEGAQNDFRCKYVQDSVDCLEKLESEDVQFGLFTAEEALLAAADDRDVYVVADARHSERKNENYDFQMVTVVRSDAKSGKDSLRGKKYCNSAPASSRYWTDSVHMALEKSITKSLSLSCNENRTFIDIETEALSQFFSSGCRPGRWSVNQTLDAKLKKKYSNLCALCDNQAKCEYSEEKTHGNSKAALDCLDKKGGDIAFVTLQAVNKFKQENATSLARFHYLCENGTTQPLSNTTPCTWIKQSWPVLLAKQNKAEELRSKLKSLYSETSKSSNSWTERLKLLIAPESYDIHVLDSNAANNKVKSYVIRGRPIPTSSSQCGSHDIKWCTRTQEELKKCRVLSKAGLTHGIVPNIACETPVENVTECLKSIKNDHAEIVSSPSDYGFIARKSYNLSTVMYVEGVNKAKYTGLIVLKKNSTIKSISELKGKSACFPFFNGMGWLTFLQAAWSKNLISRDVCTEDPKVIDFFGKSCVPGANSPLNLLNQTSSKRLCEACSLKGLRGNCEENVNNPAFGEIGALKCLTEGAGDVAFLNYHVIQTIIGRGNNTKGDDLVILCKNDTIVNWTRNDLENCAINSVIGNEILTKKDLKKGRFDDIQLSLEAFADWFSTLQKNDKIVHLFGDFQQKKNVLLPSDGVGFDSPNDITAIYVKEYDDLQQNLKHCSGGASSLFLSLSLTLTSFLLYILVK